MNKRNSTLPFLSEHLYNSILRHGFWYHCTGLIRTYRAVTEGYIGFGFTSSGWDVPSNTWNEINKLNEKAYFTPVNNCITDIRNKRAVFLYVVNFCDSLCLLLRCVECSHCWCKAFSWGVLTYCVLFVVVVVFCLWVTLQLVISLTNKLQFKF